MKVTLSITLTSPKDRGVVAFSLLAIHVALQTGLWGANQHESHWVFNIKLLPKTIFLMATLLGAASRLPIPGFQVRGRSLVLCGMRNTAARGRRRNA